MLLSLARRVANCFQDILDVMLDGAQLHHHLLEGGGGSQEVQRRGSRNGKLFIDFPCEGVHSSSESCCFFPGCAVGLTQCCILHPYCIHLLEQFIEVVVDPLFKGVEVPLNLDVGLLDSTQAGSGVLKVVFRSVIDWIIVDKGTDCCCDQSMVPDVQWRVSIW
jgi:hypothetical protein